MSCYVNTVKGPVSPRELGITLMHEHLAELNNSMKRCYADWFHADIFLEKIKPVFQKAKKYGLSTYVDQTAVNMGRDIRFIKRVSESCDVNIVAATGLFFYEESWQIDKPYEEISELFPPNDPFRAEHRQPAARRIPIQKSCLRDPEP